MGTQGHGVIDENLWMVKNPERQKRKTERTEEDRPHLFFLENKLTHEHLQVAMYMEDAGGNLQLSYQAILVM